MLAVIGFSMSMVGTFIVRSGLLTSVHSFAVDPERGTFLLVLMLVYIGGALTLFAFRAHAAAPGNQFPLLRRARSLGINNLFLTQLPPLVILGTPFPLRPRRLGQAVAVVPPLYTKVDRHSAVSY